MNKFEQLIEFVINDEQNKAKALFHEIVVEQSRTIYEDIMSEEEDENNAEAVEESIDDADLGGSQVDSLIDEVEAEEEGVTFEDEDEIELVDFDGNDDVEAEEEELEDRVVGLEDKLDELMAEFEELMGQVDDNTDDIDSDDEVDFEVDVESDDEVELEGRFNENVELKAVPKPANTSTSSKSPVAANSGAKGSVAKPVTASSTQENGRSAPKAQDQGNTTRPDVKPAVKPQLAQAAGVNAKSPIA
jgi:hypothetical protein|tara:strand:+ start:2004 stop:2741 length:738 start_codon:yes stop_codon:yes gene_type:complete